MGIRHTENSLRVNLHVAQQDVAISDVDQVVLGMPGDVSAAAADGVIALFGAQIVGPRR